MRYVTLLLVALLALVHMELWVGRNGVPRVVELSSQLREQQTRNDGARLANARLAAEVRDLQEGLEMIEERARGELGMVKPDEILVQLTGPSASRRAPPQGQPAPATDTAGKATPSSPAR